MPLTIGRTRVIVHPLALLYPLAAAMLGAGSEVASLLIALILHEVAHLLIAHCLGVGISKLRVTPFGGAMAMDNPYGLSPLRLAAVAAAGPLANLLAVIATGALAHWQMTDPYFALAFIQTNLVLLAFNLLPALPLDKSLRPCCGDIHTGQRRRRATGPFGNPYTGHAGNAAAHQQARDRPDIGRRRRLPHPGRPARRPSRCPDAVCRVQWQSPVIYNRRQAIG